MKVKMTMHTRQKYDGDLDSFVLEHSGVLMQRGEQFLLSYFQEGVHHGMKLYPTEGRLEIIRNWKEEEKLLYEGGVRWKVDYETEVGVLPLEFDTAEVDFRNVDFFRGQGEIRLYYTLFQFGQKVAETELSIAISPYSE